MGERERRVPPRDIVNRAKQRKEARFNELMVEIQMVSLIKDKGLAKRLSELSVLLTQGDSTEYIAKELQGLSDKLMELAQYEIKGEIGND